MRTCVCVFAFLLAAGTGGAAAQDNGPLSADRAELLDLTNQLRFGCDPDELAAAEGSSFRALVDGTQVEGRAVFGMERDGDLIVMMGSFDQSGGQCFVWASHDGAPAIGTWPVVPLSPALMNGELEGRHFAGGWFLAIDTVSRTLVPDSGTLVFTAVEPGRLTGSFTLEGWTATEGVAERGRMRTTGSFVAVEPK